MDIHCASINTHVPDVIRYTNIDIYAFTQLYMYSYADA
jgi:hypothetical protein